MAKPIKYSPQEARRGRDPLLKVGDIEVWIIGDDPLRECLHLVWLKRDEMGAYINKLEGDCPKYPLADTPLRPEEQLREYLLEQMPEIERRFQEEGGTMCAVLAPDPLLLDAH